MKSQNVYAKKNVKTIRLFISEAVKLTAQTRNSPKLILYSSFPNYLLIVKTNNTDASYLFSYPLPNSVIIEKKSFFYMKKKKEYEKEL